MNKTFTYFFATSLWLAACTSEQPNESQPDTEPIDTVPASVTLGGYASPESVLILNEGARMLENGSLAYISPDGNAQSDIYKSTNGTELGNQAIALDLYGNKLYIICNDYLKPEGVSEGDGLLIIANAETLQKEKAYQREEMVFARPEGCKQENEYLEMESSLSNIIVLDEKNIFIADAQAVYRFDSTTGKLALIEGSYAFGNQGVTIESIISPSGMTAINGCIYAGAGGFWSETMLVEFVKGSDKVNRTLKLGKGNLISGLCKLNDSTLVAGTYARESKSSYLYYIDIKDWAVKDEKRINETISPDVFTATSSGIFAYNGDIYFPQDDASLARISSKTGRTEEVLNVRNDAANANGFDCMTVDATKGWLYISTHMQNSESIIPESNLLIYDLNEETPRLLKDFSNLTRYAAGIYPTNRFSAN